MLNAASGHPDSAATNSILINIVAAASIYVDEIGHDKSQPANSEQTNDISIQLARKTSARNMIDKFKQIRRTHYKTHCMKQTIHNGY